jgi:hypothetical protein
MSFGAVSIVANTARGSPGADSAAQARRYDQALKEEATILVAKEHDGTVVSALDDGQDRAGKPALRLARHALMLPAPRLDPPSSEWHLRPSKPFLHCDPHRLVVDLPCFARQ